jgi:hypothetical protein
MLRTPHLLISVEGYLFCSVYTLQYVFTLRSLSAPSCASPLQAEHGGSQGLSGYAQVVDGGLVLCRRGRRRLWMVGCPPVSWKHVWLQTFCMGKRRVDMLFADPAR